MEVDGTYVMRYTDAPPSYDGFGTIVFETTEKKTPLGQLRCVMIAKQHLDWQETRYASGMYASLTPQQFHTFYSED